MINYKYSKTSPDIICIFIFAILTVLSFFSAQINHLLGNYKYYLYFAITVVFYLTASFLSKGKVNISTKKFFLLKRFKLRMFSTTIYAAIIVCLFTILSNILFVSIFKIEDFGGTNPLTALNEHNPVLSFLAVVLAPAIFEELFFRGAYFNKYKKSGIWAFIASSLAFAFMHATPYNFIGPLVSGFVFCILVFIFDSVYPAIIAHLINNIAVLLLSAYSPSIHTAGLDGFFIIGCILLLLIFIYLFIGKITSYLHKIPEKEKHQFTFKNNDKSDIATPFNLWFFLLFALWVGKCIAILLGFL